MHSLLIKTLNDSFTHTHTPPERVCPVMTCDCIISHSAKGVTAFIILVFKSIDSFNKNF